MSTSAERMRRLRERRVAGLQPSDGGPVLRDAAGLLLPGVEASLAALRLGERDAGAAQLARGYAQMIDGASDRAWAYRWIGPLLLRALRDLGATPATRGVVQPDPVERPPNWLDQQREARARRQPRRSL